MFEIPAPAKYYFLKTKSKILWNTNFLQMRRKIIDDYCLWYLNELFGIKLIFYDPSWMLQLSEFAWTKSMSGF